MKIEELNLSVRSYHCLKRAGIHTVEQLLSKSKDDLMRIHGMGLLSVTEVMTAMKRLKMTEGDKIRGMSNKELAEFIRNEQCNAVMLQRIESVPAILERLKQNTGGGVDRAHDGSLRE